MIWTSETSWKFPPGRTCTTIPTTGEGGRGRMSETSWRSPLGRTCTTFSTTTIEGTAIESQTDRWDPFDRGLSIPRTGGPSVPNTGGPSKPSAGRPSKPSAGGVSMPSAGVRDGTLERVWADDSAGARDPRARLYKGRAESCILTRTEVRDRWARPSDHGLRTLDRMAGVSRTHPRPTHPKPRGACMTKPEFHARTPARRATRAPLGRSSPWLHPKGWML